MDQHLAMVGFHMQGDGLSWFKWLHNNNLLTDWHSFTRALELCFGLKPEMKHISITKLSYLNPSKPPQSQNTKAGLNVYAIVWWVSLPRLYLIVSFLV